MAVQSGGRTTAVLAATLWVYWQPPTICCLDPRHALWGPIIANVWWGIPFFAITLLAALQSIPADIYEAAAIDGAGPWMQISPHHPAVSRAHHGHHDSAAHGMDRQLRRSDRDHDQRRPGRLHANSRQLHFHPGVSATRFWLCLGSGYGASGAAAGLRHGSDGAARRPHCAAPDPHGTARQGLLGDALPAARRIRQLRAVPAVLAAEGFDHAERSLYSEGVRLWPSRATARSLCIGDSAQPVPAVLPQQRHRVNHDRAILDLVRGGGRLRFLQISIPRQVLDRGADADHADVSRWS